MRLTKDWIPPIEEIYTIEKVNGKWLTIFGDNKTIFVGKLEQNWIGSWKLIDDYGRLKPLAYTTYPFQTEDNGVTVDAHGLDNNKMAYYFGMVTNPNVNEVRIKAQGKEYKDIPFILVDDIRFSF